MSQVKAKDRKSNQFQPTIAAKVLSEYTSKILANPKVFSVFPEIDECTDQADRERIINELTKLPAYNPKLELLKRIDNVACSIYIESWQANNVRVSNRISYNRRMGHHKRALENCIELLALIDKARAMFHLRSKKYEYWSKLACDTRDKLIHWASSDAKRYTEYQ